MKRLLDIFRFVFISPEVVIGVCVYLTYQGKPAWFNFLGNKFASSGEVINPLLLGSIAVLAWTYKESKSILYPIGDNRILLNWPDYPMLRNRVLYGLFLLFICLLALIGILLVKDDLSPEVLGLTVILTFCVLGCVIITHVLASIAVRGMLEKLS